MAKRISFQLVQATLAVFVLLTVGLLTTGCDFSKKPATDVESTTNEANPTQEDELTVEEQLAEIAGTMNISCPILVDAETRLDSVGTMPGKIVTYSYTLVNMDQKSINVEVLSKYIKKNSTTIARTNPEMQYFRDNAVTLSYHYYDKDNVFVTNVVITPDMYK